MKRRTKKEDKKKKFFSYVLVYSFSFDFFCFCPCFPFFLALCFLLYFLLFLVSFSNAFFLVCSHLSFSVFSDFLSKARFLRTQVNKKDPILSMKPSSNSMMRTITSTAMKLPTNVIFSFFLLVFSFFSVFLLYLLSVLLFFIFSA